jgi:hypothetical protein
MKTVFSTLYNTQCTAENKLYFFTNTRIWVVYDILSFYVNVYYICYVCNMLKERNISIKCTWYTGARIINVYMYI